ncbi:MAG: hypothetical protein ACTS7E_03405 [Arsenophonus sp. NC-CH8-MAG3]
MLFKALLFQSADGIGIEDHVFFHRESIELSKITGWHLHFQVLVMGINFLMILHALDKPTAISY